jgi:DNA-binding beta-propeller fold protein YncE
MLASLFIVTACIATPPPSATPTSDPSPAASPTGGTADPARATAPASAVPTATPLAPLLGVVDVRRSVFAVAFDPRSGHVYVRTDTGVASVDPVARTVMSHIEDLGSPGLSAGLAFDEQLGFLYVSSRDGRVAVVRPESDGGLALVATIHVAEGLGPITVDTRTHDVYVLDMGVQAGVRGNPPRSGALFVISGNTRTVTTRFELPGNPIAIAVDPSTGRAYVSMRVTPQVEYVIQVLSLERLREIARVGTSVAVDLALHPRTGILYAPYPGAPGAGLQGRITVFDTRTNQAATFVSDIGAHVLAIDWIRDHLYAADIDGHVTIGRLRGPAQPPSTFERLGVNGKPMGLAADPHRRLFYVAILEGRLAIFRDDHP